MRKILPWLVATFLFVLFAFRFFLHAQGKPFWIDETDGLCQSTGRSWAQLVFEGVNGQASRTPLYYILDKAWLSIWDNRPHLYWDLRVILRILPATCWALSCVSIFVFVYAKMRSAMLQNMWVGLVIGAGAAIFFYQNSFMDIYAIETRAYALWLFLTTLHFLFLFQAVHCGLKKRGWYLWGAICLLMVYTTYASLLQIAAGFAALFFHHWQTGKMASVKKIMLPCIVIGIASLLLGEWYLSALILNYGRPTMDLYWSSLTEVFLKSFHHHGWQPGLVTAPLFLVLVPYLYRKNRLFFTISIFAWLNIIASFVLFKGSQAKGGIWASRYATYLIPSYTWFYILGLVAVFSLLVNYGNRFSPRKFQVVSVFFLFCLLQIFTRLPLFMKETMTSWDRAREAHVYGYTNYPEECNKVLSCKDQEFEALNKACRATPNKF